MNLGDVVLNYLTDNEKDMQQLITCFLKGCLIESHRMQEFAIQHDERRLSRADDKIRRFQHGLMNYRSFPTGFWKKIHTTNLLERVNKELKLRNREIGENI